MNNLKNLHDMFIATKFKICVTEMLVGVEIIVFYRSCMLHSDGVRMLDIDGYQEDNV